MTMFFTDNMTSTDVDAVNRIESVELETWAGQESEPLPIRIGNTGDEQTILVWTGDPTITLSLDRRRNFSAAIDYTAPSNNVGDSIYVKVTAPLDADEGNRTGTIIADDLVLDVNYFLASTHDGDTEIPASERFKGSETRNLIDQFEAEGEAITLMRYDPLMKPAPLADFTGTTLQAHRNQSVEEWVNPNNAQVGYEISEYQVKAFIGDRNLIQNTLYKNEDIDLEFGDTEKIALPPDFVGFDEGPTPVIEFFSQLTPTQRAYQHTQWVLLRHNQLFALSNIQKMSYYKGQMVYWMADLARTNYPGGDSTQSFLCWNQLFDEDQKPISYVPSWSTDLVAAEYDPYTGDLPAVSAFHSRFRLRQGLAAVPLLWGTTLVVNSEATMKIPNPTAFEIVPIVFSDVAVRITSVTAQTDVGTVTFALHHTAESGVYSPGTPIGTGILADEDGRTTTSFVTPSIPIKQWVTVRTSAVTGNPKQLDITLQFEKL